MLLGLLLILAQLLTAQGNTKIDDCEGLIKIKVDPTTVRYQYFPNIEAYYDFEKQVYIYKENGAWVSTPTIASNYRGYSVRNGFHVALDNYTGNQPYLLLAEHKLKYPADFSSKRRAKVVVAAN